MRAPETEDSPAGARFLFSTEMQGPLWTLGNKPGADSPAPQETWYDELFSRMGPDGHEFDAGSVKLQSSSQGGDAIKRRMRLGDLLVQAKLVSVRSEERRVGKEGRSRWPPHH